MRCIQYDMRKEHVDVFLGANAKSFPEYKDFWSVCKLVFIFFTWPEFN